VKGRSGRGGLGEVGVLREERIGFGLGLFCIIEKRTEDRGEAS